MSKQFSSSAIEFLKDYKNFIDVATNVEGDGILIIGYGHCNISVQPGGTIYGEGADLLLNVQI